jgi:hypothetical protein
MTTLPPIQPRPILCKTPTNNTQSSSVFLIHSSTQPSTVINTNFYPTNSDLTNNNNNNNNNSSQAPPPSIPLSSYEEFLKRLREFHRCRQYVSFIEQTLIFFIHLIFFLEQHFVVYQQLPVKLLIYKPYTPLLLAMVDGIKSMIDNYGQ